MDGKAWSADLEFQYALKIGCVPPGTNQTIHALTEPTMYCTPAFMIWCSPLLGCLVTTLVSALLGSLSGMVERNEGADEFMDHLMMMQTESFRKTGSLIESQDDAETTWRAKRKGATRFIIKV